MLCQVDLDGGEMEMNAADYESLSTIRVESLIPAIITWHNIYAEYVASNIEGKPSNKLSDERSRFR